MHNLQWRYKLTIRLEKHIMEFKKEWEGFTPGLWNLEINVRDFIQKNYTPYDGDDSFFFFLFEATSKLWDHVMDVTA